MNELKDPAKKKKKKKDERKLQLIHQGVSTKNYNQGTVLHLCTTTTAAAATTTKRIFLIYLRAIHNITRTFTHIQKKLLLEGDTHIEAVRKGQKYFTNSTSYRKI